MNNHADPRVAELEQLAAEEDIKLPYPASFIVWLEDRGRVVDLATGDVFETVTIQPERYAMAVAHLLAA